jgi:hypothetical protein
MSMVFGVRSGLESDIAAEPIDVRFTCKFTCKNGHHQIEPLTLRSGVSALRHKAGTSLTINLLRKQDDIAENMHELIHSKLVILPVGNGSSVRTVTDEIWNIPGGGRVMEMRFP